MEEIIEIMKHNYNNMNIFLNTEEYNECWASLIRFLKKIV